MEDSQRLVDLANKHFSDIIREGFKLFFRNYKTLILPLAFFQVLLILLNIFLLTDLKWYVDSIEINISDIMDKFTNNVPISESEWKELTSFLLLNLAIFLIENLIGAVIITIAMCSVSKYLFERYLHIDTNFLVSFKSAFNKKIFLVVLIIGICIPLSSLLLFIPAIIIFGFFIFLVYTYNMDEVDNPIREARRIAKGNFWKIIIVFAFNFIFIFMFSFIFNSIIELFLDPNSAIFSYNYNLWLDPDTRNYGMLILYQILVNLMDIFLAPLFICFLTSLFASLKAKKDLGFNYQRKYYPVREMTEKAYFQSGPSYRKQFKTIDESTPPESQSVSHFYCPFCGRVIKTPKRFCSNCGENISFINE
ncbi:MAG: hypothetical protein ACFFA0_03495 [Promethearchaeota archaeon]